MVIARGADGNNVIAFDTVENRHRDEHILDITLAPARMRPMAVRAEAAQDIASRVAQVAWIWSDCLRWKCLSTRMARVIVNEIAPRPHNSGHWTIDACPCKPVRIAYSSDCGACRCRRRSRHSDAVMKNLIGSEGLALWPADRRGTPGLIPHLYGKEVALPGRKMGHVTRLFPHGGLPDDAGVSAALGVAAPR